MNSGFQTNPNAFEEVSKRIANLSPAKRALLELKLKKRAGEKLEKNTIPKRKEREIAHLSFAQQRLWFMCQLEPENAFYNMHRTYRLRGAFHVEVMHRTVNAVIERHESLRTTFVASNGTPVQKIAQTLTIDLPVMDLRDLDPDAQEAAVERLVSEDARRAFDLEAGPLVRTSLLKLGEEDHALMLSMHHIISDGWSMMIFSRELWSIYKTFLKGESLSLPAIPAQYADFSQWQRNWLTGEMLKKQLNYWKDRLADIPAVLEIPKDSHPSIAPGYRGARITEIVSSNLLEDLKAFSRASGATLYMTLLATFQLLLHRYTGRDDILVGSPIAGRNHLELEQIIGFFVNTLVVRTNFSGDPTFRVLLDRVRDAALGAYENQDLPFEKLVEELKPERKPGRNPFFEVMFNLVNLSPGTDKHECFSVQRISISGSAAKFPLEIYINEVSGELRLDMVYQTELFSRERIACMMDQFKHLLSQVIENPTLPVSEYSLVTPSSQRLLPDPGLRIGEPDQKLVATTFLDLARQMPEQVAVSFGSRNWSYGDLARYAMGIAHCLREQGLDKGDVIAIPGLRGPGMVASMMGIFLAGGVFLLVDDTLPIARKRMLLKGASVKALIFGADKPLDDQWLAAIHDLGIMLVNGFQGGPGSEAKEEFRTSNSLPAISPEDPAYIFFTSGTTGTPKGVLGCHKGLSHFVDWQQKTFDITSKDRVSQLTSLSFDPVLRDIFLSLTSGASVHLPEQDDWEDIFNWLENQKITVIHTVPTLIQSWLAKAPEGPTLRNLRYIFISGEALTETLVDKWRAAFPGSGEIVNLYGPTETTMTKCFYRVPAISLPGTQPIGKPMPQTQALILSKSGRPCGIGEPGEIVLRTPYRTLGYINEDPKTQNRFARNPFRNDEQDLIYYTGDLGRYRPDGSIDISGRLDEQVKINGVRIEPGEISEALCRHPGIRSCAVAVRPDQDGRNYLVAYVVKKYESGHTGREIRSFLTNQLPAVMVPRAFVFLERLPMTPSGKTDYKALPDPDIRKNEEPDSDELPRGYEEKLLAEIWRDVLEVKCVGVYDNFFELGGHSLLGVQMVSRIRSLFQVSLPLRILFEAPTIAELAEKIHQTRSKIGLSEDALVFPSRLPRRCVDDLPLIPRKNRSEQLPLSFAQQRLWFLFQLESESPYYNRPLTWRLKGPFDIDAMRRALNIIVERHETLRTTFTLKDGQPIQQIRPSLTIDLPVTDVATESREARKAVIEKLCDDEARKVFNLEKGPLLRVFLIRLGPEDHLMVLNIHHIISDGWSMEVLNRELFESYDSISGGKPLLLPELPVQYSDYAVWQREWLHGEVLEKQVNYWRGRLSGAPPLLKLPTDRPRPVVQRLEGRRYKVIWPGGLLKDLKTLSRKSDVTLYMTLLAGFQLLLHRYTGQEDILVGSPIAGRNRTEVENLIGFFVNTIVLRTDFSGNPTFWELLKRVRKGTLGAYEHQDLPFEKLVEELQPERNLSHTPIFQIAFALQNMPIKFSRSSQLLVSRENIDVGTAKFDLTLFVREIGEKLHATMEYSTVLFDHSTIVRMMDQLKVLLEGIASDPGRTVSDLPLLTESERRRILLDWNVSDTVYPKDLCAHDIFEMQAHRTPGATALEFDGHHLSYRELDVKSNQLAHFLRTRGVKQGVFVCLYMERSIDMVIGMLGILKAGGAYVPLDPSYPEERLAIMIGECDPQLLLTQQKFHNKLSAGLKVESFCVDSNWKALRFFDETRPVIDSRPDDLAYMIYTSGSTGRPKGVCVPHRAISRLVINTNYMAFTGSDRVAHVSNPSFDAATFEIWGALLNGGCLVGMRNEVLLSPELFGKQLRKKRISALFVTTALFNQIAAEAPSAFESLEYLLFGGEAVDPKWVRAVLQKGAPKKLLHVYGPTENTTFSTWYAVKSVHENAMTIPIGSPISNSSCHILDKHFNPVPVGVPGELFLGGAGLFRGYYLQPELTAEKLIPNPYAKSAHDCLYRTGDIARYLPDGNIEFIGRVDNQIKLRGFRIELGEIESVLCLHPSLQNAVALLREARPGNKRIVAYYVSKPGEKTDKKQIRDYLSGKLPEYMVPSHFISLDALPLTQNGKVDRKALPEPGEEQASIIRDDHAPRDSLEAILAKIWEKALGTGSVGIRDNFFDLGGHSLLVIQVVSYIKKQLGKEIAPADFFMNPTIEQLADIFRSEGWSSPFSLLRPYQILGEKPPFFCIHGEASEVAAHLGSDQPFYSAFAHGCFGDRIPDTVEQMAADYIEEIRAVQPDGPYFIGGYSFGGLVAFEIAHLLKKMGEKTVILVLIDPTTIDHGTLNSSPLLKGRSNSGMFHIVYLKAVIYYKKFIGMEIKDKLRAVFALPYNVTIKKKGVERLLKFLACKCVTAFGLPVPLFLRGFYQYEYFFPRVALDYMPRKYQGPAALFYTEKKAGNSIFHWQNFFEDKLEVYELPGRHLDLFKVPQAVMLAEKLKICFQQAQRDVEYD